MVNLHVESSVVTGLSIDKLKKILFWPVNSDFCSVEWFLFFFVGGGCLLWRGFLTMFCGFEMGFLS